MKKTATFLNHPLFPSASRASGAPGPAASGRAAPRLFSATLHALTILSALLVAIGLMAAGPIASPAARADGGPAAAEGFRDDGTPSCDHECVVAAKARAGADSGASVGARFGAVVGGAVAGAMAGLSESGGDGDWASRAREGADHVSSIGSSVGALVGGVAAGAAAGAVMGTHAARRAGPAPAPVAVSAATGLDDGAPVALRGTIVRRLGADRYEFMDRTGAVLVAIDGARWAGRVVTPRDTLEIRGAVVRGDAGPLVEVESLDMIR